MDHTPAAGFWICEFPPKQTSLDSSLDTRYVMVWEQRVDIIYPPTVEPKEAG